MKGGSINPIEPVVGQVVLIKEPAARNKWKLARVEKLFYGQDHKTRSALLRLPAGIIIRRPIKLLYPLEESVKVKNLRVGVS